MKIFRELIIIFGIYAVGEFLSSWLSLPLPGSLIGMLLLLLLLMLKVVELKQIAKVSSFLLDHLSFFFIPAGVALMSVFEEIREYWVLILFICAITTILTMGVTGMSIQKLLERKQHK